jgi:hypothetical protein
MIARLIYACSQPSERPLRRVTLYYAALFGVGAVLLRTVPGVAEFATQGPMDVGGFAGLSDSFEPIGAPDIVRNQLDVAGRLLFNLMAALLLMLPVSWVYMGTRSRTGFDQSVVQTMIILPIAVAGIVTIVHDSIALAFSLAGIVAGVRFRNALKDTADALYIFAAIGVGLACGIGALLVAALVSVFFNSVILLLWRCDYGVCPKGGAMMEYTSGRTFAQLGIDLPSPTTEAGASKKAKTGKKKKKKEKKKHGGALAIAETVDPVAAPVADAGGAVAAVGEDVPEPPEPVAR